MRALRGSTTAWLLGSLALLCGVPALASSTAPRTQGSLAGLEERLANAPPDPLALFQLSFDVTPRQLAGLARVHAKHRLKAGPDVYDRVSMIATERSVEGLFPAPGGLNVIDAEFFFVNGTRLVEASIELHAGAGPRDGIRSLEGALGHADFEVVLPGALDLALGWRTANGYALATFSDLDLCKITVFRNDPDDLLAGSQLMLFEGLADYARRLAAGATPQQLAPELARVVNWVAMARSNLEPVN